MRLFYYCLYDPDLLLANYYAYFFGGHSAPNAFGVFFISIRVFFKVLNV